MQTIRIFNSLEAAMDYRYENGTGGWIFKATMESPDNNSLQMFQAVLFSPDFTPSAIFSHPITRGYSGCLIP